MKIVYCKIENSQPLRIFMKDMVSNDIQLDLLPEQTVYTETDDMTFSLRVFEKKGVIKISRGAKKPSHLEFYSGYDPEDIKPKNTSIIEVVIPTKVIHEVDIETTIEMQGKDQILRHIIDSLGNDFNTPLAEGITVWGNKTVPQKSIVDEAIEEVKGYQEEKLKKKSYYKPKLGRPKKRGPKKKRKK